jgi:hypothetical protein
MEVGGQIYASPALLLGTETLIPFGWIGWASEPVRTRWWREKFPATVGTRTSEHPARSSALYHWDIPAAQLLKKSAICIRRRWVKRSVDLVTYGPSCEFSWVHISACLQVFIQFMVHATDLFSACYKHFHVLKGRIALCTAGRWSF